jgi:hypothetical protein
MPLLWETWDLMVSEGAEEELACSDSGMRNVLHPVHAHVGDLAASSWPDDETGRIQWLWQWLVE